MLPSGSSRPVLNVKDELYLAGWVAPDGQKRWAVWSTDNKDASSIEIEGKAQFVSYLGEKLKSMPEISDKVVFITGAEEVKIKNE